MAPVFDDDTFLINTGSHTRWPSNFSSDIPSIHYRNEIDETISELVDTIAQRLTFCQATCNTVNEHATDDFFIDG